jgi:hypothetical protein
VIKLAEKLVRRYFLDIKRYKNGSAACSSVISYEPFPDEFIAKMLNENGGSSVYAETRIQIGIN